MFNTISVTTHTYILISLIYLCIYIFSTIGYILLLNNNNKSALRGVVGLYKFSFIIFFLSLVIGLPPAPTFFIKVLTIQILFDCGHILLPALVVIIYFLNWVIVAKFIVNKNYTRIENSTSNNSNSNSTLVLILFFIICCCLCDFSWLLVVLSK